MTARARIALTFGLVLPALVVVGCSDASSDEAFVRRLERPEWQAAAAREIRARFHAARDRDARTGGSEAKRLADVAVSPLARACETSPSEDLPVVADTLAVLDDPRGAPCWLRALSEPRTPAGNLLRAVSKHRIEGAARPIWDRLSPVTRSPVTRELHAALLAAVDPSLGKPALDVLRDRESQPPEQRETALYRRVLAVEVLGRLRDPRAVPLLLAEVVAPPEPDVVPTVLSALVRIGRPALGPTLDLLAGRDRTLEALWTSHWQELERSKALPPGAARPTTAGAAAVVLGALGLPEAITPLVERAKTVDPATRAVIATELALLPASPESVACIRSVYESTPVELVLPPGVGAKAAVAEAAGRLFDPAVVPWLVGGALAAKGDPTLRDEARAGALRTALKLAEVDQLPLVERLMKSKSAGPSGRSSELGAGFQHEWRATREQLDSCRGELPCLFGRVERGLGQSHVDFATLKATYALGRRAEPRHAAALTDLAFRVRDPALGLLLTRIVDRLSPAGAPDIEREIERRLVLEEVPGDAPEAVARAPLRTLALRLRARGK